MPEIIDLSESDCQNSDSFGSIDGKEEIDNFGVKMRDISADVDTDISIVELSNDEDFGSQTSKDEIDKNKASNSKGNVESHSKMSKDKNETSFNNAEHQSKTSKNDLQEVVLATKKSQDIRNFFFKMNGEAKKRNHEIDETDSPPVIKKANLEIDESDEIIVLTNGFHVNVESLDFPSEKQSKLTEKQSESSEKQSKLTEKQSESAEKQSKLTEKQSSTTEKQTVSAPKAVDVCKGRKVSICLRRLEEEESEHFSETLREELEKLKLAKKTEGQEYEVEAVIDYAWCKESVKHLSLFESFDTK
jgi:hypothetical protein